MFNWDSLLSIIIVLTHGIAYTSCESVNITDFAYHVSVEYNDEHSCSGVLITESWILTVAACVYSHGLTGLSARVATDIPSTGGQQVEIKSVIIHDDFDSISYINDIALLNLRTPLEYGDGKLPIILPSSDYDIADETITLVTGWTVDAQGNAESELTVVSTPIINQTTCSSSLPVFKELTDSMLCAGYMTESTEVCQGDMGSPLVSDDQLLVGLLSYGLGCAVPTYPVVYTRISSFVPWILNYTGVIFN